MKDAIVAVVGVVKDLLLHVYKLNEQGKHDEAVSVVAEFEAFTKAQLDADREAAEEILEKRFPQ